jgi:peptide/nickel transport system substrate-binding protein
VAVPQDTPTELQPGEFLPATGPYVIDSYLPQGDAADGHGRLTLVRNRYFREWSSAAQPAGYPDRIVLDTGYTYQEGAARVIDGRADLLWFGVTDGDVDRLRARYSAQTHTNPGAFVGHVFLNTTKPPFNNADARRALAFALDRRALADLSMGQPTCQLVPPDFPAHKPYCPFTVRPGDGRWTGPNLAAADRLAEGSKARGAKVRVVVHSGRPFEGRAAEAGRRVVATLDRLGFDASFRVLTFDDFFKFVFDPKNPYNAGLTMWGADYPAASQYVAAMGACDGTFNIGGLCDRALTARMSEATELQLTDPAAANDAWADLDREVVRAAAVIPFSTIQQQDFVSHRVGNLTVHPLYGPLVAQMWVQ